MADDLLGARGEGEWALLRRQLELASGFWLGFIFAASPRHVTVLRQRTEHLLRLRARTMEVVRPATPDELRSAVVTALTIVSPISGCFWLESVRTDPPPDATGDPGPSRDRSTISLSEKPSTSLSVRESESSTAPRWGFRVSGPIVAARLEEVEKLLGSGLTGDAIEVAHGAVEAARGAEGAGGDLPVALAWLSRAEEEHGDHPAAVHHVNEALAYKEEIDDRLREELLDRAGRLALARNDLAGASAAYGESEKIRQRLDEISQTPPPA